MAVDVQAIIAKVMADPKVQSSMRLGEGHFAAHVYEDEPILKTGRQVLAERASALLPEPYRRARDLEHAPEARRWSDARLFYEEARVLAEAEDDQPYRGTFERYYPSYRMMSDRQLRGYVTWRTHVRAGWAEEAPASFAFVYVYELLNGVGVAGGADGFRELRRFWDAYRELVPDLGRYLRGWLLDYAVWWGVDPALAAADPAFAGDVARDRALDVVLNPQGHGEDERFGAVVRLSGYALEKSRFYRDYPLDVRRVLLAVVDELEAYYRKHRKRGLFETLFGSPVSLPREPFPSALFYQPGRHADTVYELDPLRRYRCQGGLWTCERVYGGKGEGRALGAVVKIVDARMRGRCGYPHPLKEGEAAKYLVRIVDRAIDDWMAEREARAARAVVIDRAKLGGIRASAALTCEALLVDEERLGDVPAAPASAPAACRAPAPVPRAPSPAPSQTAAVPRGSAPAAATSAPGACGLSDAERLLLGRLLAGASCEGVPAGFPGSLDMLVDAVNEKLYDLVGDAVVEFDGSRPALIEDYREDVEGILQP